MGMSPCRVCLAAPYPPPYGGIARWAAMIKTHAAGRRDVELVIVNTTPRWRAIHDTRIWLRIIGGGVQLVADLAQLARAMAARRCDVVHLTTSGQLAVVRDLFIANLVAIFGVGLVYHIRFGRIPLVAPSKAVEWRLIRRVMRHASKVLVIDEATFAAVQVYAPEANVELIPNCIDFSDLPPLPARSGDVKTVLFVGWVLPSKGVGELVAAWAKLTPSGWHLEIVGPGDPAYQSELVRRFGSHRIRFAGEHSHAEAMARIANCDLFVLPSHTEGFPNALLEAMALGRAIVATDVGAIPEMLAGNAGILVKPRDVHGLSLALRRVMEDDTLRLQLGRTAQERAKELYSVDGIFEHYCRVWRNAAGANKRS